MIGPDRFRQSAMARNCLFRRTDLSVHFSRTAVSHRRLRAIGYLLEALAILKSLSLSFNVYDAAGSNAPALQDPTGESA